MSRRRHYCRGCERESEQRRVHVTNGDSPVAETWRCESCRLEFLTLGSVLDAEGLCLYVTGELRRLIDTGDSGRWLDFDDLLGRMREELWVAWSGFDPTRSVPFTAYATGTLRQRRTDWLREQLGRNVPKAFADAASLDAAWADIEVSPGPGIFGEPDGPSDLRSRLGAALAERTVDGGEHSLADLRRAIALRRGEIAEQERGLGVGAAA